MVDGKIVVSKSLAKEIAYSKGAIVSRQLVSVDGLNVTLFSFDAGQLMSSHSSNFPATVEILEGKVEFTLGSKKHEFQKGAFVFMPKGLPHALLAKTRMKMLLSLGKAIQPAGTAEKWEKQAKKLGVE